MKSKFILILAIVFTVITTFLFNNYLRNLDNKYKNGNNLVQVAVLKKDTKKNQIITNDMLELKSYNSSSVLPGTVKNIKDIEGSYTLIDMKAGELLFPDRFTKQSVEKEYLTRKINEGNRAVSIAVTYVESVSTIVEPEDKVDVIYSKKLPDGTFESMTLLQNIRVLAVGERLTESPKSSTIDTAKKEVQASTNQAKYTTLTLELDPKQAEQITNAEENGDLKFALRSEFE